MGNEVDSKVNLQKLREAVNVWLRSNRATQKVLANKAGPSQTTISNLLKGIQIGRESAEKLAKAVDLPLEGLEGPTGPDFAFCGSPDCPSVCLAALGGRVYAAPRFQRLTKSTMDNCPYCNSAMYRECPNCRASISEKVLCCPECKQPYVPVPDDLEGLAPRDLVRECLMRNRVNEQFRRHLADDS